MGKVGLVLDNVFRRHHTGLGHPERPERIDAIAAAMNASGHVDRFTRVPPAEADDDALLRVHARDYLLRVNAACRQGEPYIDTPDSAISPESEHIARLAAGAVLAAARRIGRGEIQRAFCAVRPPGHHAEAARSMGFCLFNNIAIAAAALRRECGVERVAILDWDVHHGNGTQHTFERDPSVLFVSLHGHPHYLYPGTGFVHETGIDAGNGFTLNIPLMPGTDDAEYQAEFRNKVIPTIERFEPQVLLISAGFDAHREDPIGNLSLTDETFAWMTQQAIALADRFAEGRILSVLEGGYNLNVLRRCVPAHAMMLLDA